MVGSKWSLMFLEFSQNCIQNGICFQEIRFENDFTSGLAICGEDHYD